MACLCGTLDASGQVNLLKDGHHDPTIRSTGENTKPRRLALGGSQANSNFSISEVAEVVIFDRTLAPNEIDNLSNNLRTKWLGVAQKTSPY